MVLHLLEQRRDRLRAEVLLAAVHERVRLVDEEDAAQRVARRPRSPWSRSGRRSPATSPERSVSTSWPFETTPSVWKICASRRATVVLPVPGLPTKTRWRLWSTTGSLRSRRRFSTRMRFVSSRTSVFTASSPTSSSSSASSSSSGRARRGRAVVDGLGLADAAAACRPAARSSPPPRRRSIIAAERVDREQLLAGRDVGRCAAPAWATRSAAW